VTSSITGAVNAGSLKALLELYMESIPEITLAALLDNYEVLLFDAYGVLVHADGALPGAAALLARLQRVGKTYYMLTNDASKLPTNAATHYQSYGLPLDPEHIISSGELLRLCSASAHRGALCRAGSCG
jgi:ribonucleotide monophosphatase NagD (HAD superfamily)